MTEELKQALRTIEHLRASPLMANHRAGLDAAHQLLSLLSQRPAAQEVASEAQELAHNMMLWREDARMHGSEYVPVHVRTLDNLIAQLRGLPAPHQATPESSRGMIGMGAHALANELAQAVAQDDADPDGHDMSAGLFGPNVSAWLRKISADYLPQHATPEPVGEPDTVPLDALHAAERERDYWKTRARAMLDHADGTCWYWMGDGEDHLESLVNSLPVVIRADQLRELLARPAPGVPEGEPKLTQEELLEVAKYAWLKARTADSLQFYRTLLAAAQAKGQ